MTKSKKKYYKKENLDLFNGIYTCLMYENTILRKKLNNEQLSKEEEIFDTLIVPPSFVLRQINKLSKKEGEKNEKN